ncbi:MAG TPA: D-alanine--D-alanine ligase, partial [Rhodothermales bacterium]|nr:D-alanine--D-alanine ligase [Rhodothermales bacterium]
MTVGLFFGGVSPEHEVSVISTLQAAHALRASERHTLVPVYVAKDGRWFTGEALLDPATYTDLDALMARAHRISLDPGGNGVLTLVETGTGGLFGRDRRHRLDVAFLGFHGGSGENGAFQGLFETFGVPYTGSGVFGSALGMDKVLSKMVCRDQGIPVVDWVAFREGEWAGHEDKHLDRIEATLGLPVVVKPARLGSSIGISKADSRSQLDASIEEALRYDEKVVVERAVQGLREVNCSVLGEPNEA